MSLVHLLCVFWSFEMATGGLIRACYYPTYSYERENRFVPEDLPSGLCTHLMYFGSVVEKNVSIRLDSHGLYSRVNDLKFKDPELKTLISINNGFEQIISSEENLEKFVENIVSLAKEKGFDGIDLDWEYPVEKKQFSTLITKIRKTIEVKTEESLLLTAAVSPSKKYIDTIYDISILKRNLDYIFVMEYDFHGSWKNVTGHNAPFNSEKGWNTAASIKYWSSTGFPNSKIVMGLPAYGRGWILDESELEKDPKIGMKGYALTENIKSAPYNRICQLQEAKRFWDVDNSVPFLVYKNQWWSYDDIESFKIKTTWVKKSFFAGVFLWAIYCDDFNNLCGRGNFPLLSAIKSSSQ